MTIRGFGSEVSTTVDVNNGDSTQTFSQVGDAEYDVNVSSVDGTDTNSGNASGGTNETSDTVEEKVLYLPGNSWTIDLSWSLSSADSLSECRLFDGGTELDSSGFNSGSSGSTSTTGGNIYVLMDGDTSYSVDWSISISPSSSVSINSITQA